MRGGASLPVQRNCSEVTFGTLFGNNGGGSVRRKIVERGGGGDRVYRDLQYWGYLFVIGGGCSKGGLRKGVWMGYDTRSNLQKLSGSL